MSALEPARGGLFVDATVGGGGHARYLLEASPDVRLFAMDRDSDAIERAQEHLKPFLDRVTFHHGPFSGLAQALPEEDHGKVMGVLGDFGLSSDQLEDRERGFSFQQDGPLDMRMDKARQKTSAAVLCARASEDELECILREFGEERFSAKIAKAIVHQRRQGGLLRTSQLAQLVSRTIRSGRQGIHPATRTFQALRIAVNHELDEIDAFLATAPRLLAEGGRLAAISFHSLEDRRVKRVFQNEVRSGEYSFVFPKSLRADAQEKRYNPRSRSASLRAIEKEGKAE